MLPLVVEWEVENEFSFVGIAIWNLLSYLLLLH